MSFAKARTCHGTRGEGVCIDLVGVLVLDPGERLEKSDQLLLARWCMCAESTR
jgi:hypothetical protein